MDMDARGNLMPRWIGGKVLVDARLPEGDLIFLPTDERGTPGELNTHVLSSLGLPVELPGADELAKGFAFREFSGGQLCFIVTVGDGAPAASLQSNLTRALRWPDAPKARRPWIPLMGTGFGGLTLGTSFAITFVALKEAGWTNRDGAEIIISPPRDLPAAAFEDLRNAIDAATLDEAVVGAGDATGDDVEDSDADAPFTSALIRSLLDYAAALGGLRGEQSEISTTQLFFALADSQASAAPDAVRDDPTIITFSEAVNSVVGARYQPFWKRYFRREEHLIEAPTPLSVHALTRNANRVMHDAASRNRDGTVTIDNLVAALLGRQRTGLADHFRSVGIDAQSLLTAFGDARLGFIDTKFRNDVVTDIDRLGYASYARAIKAFLTHPETPSPLSISIQAPWGGGKSTLMNLVRNAIDPKDVRDKHKPAVGSLGAAARLGVGQVLTLLDKRKGITVATEKLQPGHLWTVWFNAWKYETSEQVWAGLVDAIVSQVGDRLSLIEREKFLLKLQLARIDDGIIRRKIYDRVLTIWLAKVRGWALAAIAATSACFGASKVEPLAIAQCPQLAAIWKGTATAGTIGIPIALSIFLILNYCKQLFAVKSEPATYSLADYIRVPDYDAAVGQIHHIHADLRRVLDLIPKPDGEEQSPPLVIFIDDLDRCSPGKVADVVEGVSMLLADNSYSCMFVIGMDPQMVAAALEKAHEDVRSQLPPYEQTVPLGWRFMDKFIQLPFTIPPTASDRFTEYLAWLSEGDPKLIADPALSPTNADPGSPEAPSPSPDGQRPTEMRREAPDAPAPVDTPAAIASFAESRDVGTIVRLMAGSAIGNPREMKRMINLTRFYLALRRGRQEVNRGWQAPTPEQYARWIALTLRWPDMMRWLQWGNDEVNWDETSSADSLVVRRLRVLESLGATVSTAPEWVDGLLGKLGIASGKCPDWRTDAKLFAYFQIESRYPAAERLSSAAALEFW